MVPLRSAEAALLFFQNRLVSLLDELTDPPPPEPDAEIDTSIPVHRMVALLDTQVAFTVLPVEAFVMKVEVL
jgi:hypothetical protein